MEILVLFIVTFFAGAFLWISATSRDQPPKDEDRQYLEDLRRLAKEGYLLDEFGLTICMVCGSNCGQCGSGTERDGLTLEQYRLRYWQ